MAVEFLNYDYSDRNYFTYNMLMFDNADTIKYLFWIFIAWVLKSYTFLEAMEYQLWGQGRVKWMIKGKEKYNYWQ